MNPNISEKDVLNGFLEAMKPKVQWRVILKRENGAIEETIIPENVVTKDGLNAFASRGIADTTSPIGYLAIGTVTAAHSLGSVVTGFGEISRKTPVTKATSRSIVVVSAVWTAGADSLVGVALGSAACVNHANSGQGIAWNLTNSVSTTMTASNDSLTLQCEIWVGSHNL